MRKKMKLIDLQAQEQREHTNKVDAAGNDCTDRFENALQAPLQNAANNTHGGRNSIFETQFLKALLNRGIRQPFQVRNVKLEFPRFAGENVLKWIFRANQFFEYDRNSDIDRLTTATTHMEKMLFHGFKL